MTMNKQFSVPQIKINMKHLLDTQTSHQRKDCKSSSFVSSGVLASHPASTESWGIEFILILEQLNTTLTRGGTT